MTASPLAFSVRTPVTTVVAKASAPVRSLVDYSDLEIESTSLPPTDVAAEMLQSTGTQLVTAAQVSEL